MDASVTLFFFYSQHLELSSPENWQRKIYNPYKYQKADNHVLNND